MMNIKKYLLYTVLAVVLTASFSCKNDDDGGGEATPMVNTLAGACCGIPPLEGCVEGGKFYVSNAFTPNGDGFNDFFMVFASEGIEKIVSFKITDSDDNIVFEESDFLANNPAFGWDGALPDGAIVAGVYAYTLLIQNIAGAVETFEGEVCSRGDDSFPCADLENHCTYATQHDGKGGFDLSLPSFENCQ